jgi:hypothetical protein
VEETERHRASSQCKNTLDKLNFKTASFAQFCIVFTPRENLGATMKSLTDASAPSWRATPAASPWGPRPASLWVLIAQAWRESMDVYVRTGARRLPWGFFL